MAVDLGGALCPAAVAKEGLAVAAADPAASSTVDTLTALPRLEDGAVDSEPLPPKSQGAAEGPQSDAELLKALDPAANVMLLWHTRRAERRTRLAGRRADLRAQFGSQGHASFCHALCSSDCRHAGR